MEKKETNYGYLLFLAIIAALCGPLHYLCRRLCSLPLI